MKRRSRTQQAIDLVDKGLTQYAAAAMVRISPSCVTRGLQRRAAKLGKGVVACPTCKRPY